MGHRQKARFSTAALLCLAGLLTTANPDTAFATQTILVMGDSLSAAYGIPRRSGWVELLRQRLVEQGSEHRIINASISGETTGGGLARFSRQIEKHQPSLVILELGANDGLRAQSLKKMRQNLASMIQQSLAANAKVLLLGIYIPANYGQRYVLDFHQVYVDLATEYPIGFVDFFLEPIALDESYFQADRIHPTAKAQPILLDHIWDELKAQLP